MCYLPWLITCLWSAWWLKRICQTTNNLYSLCPKISCSRKSSWILVAVAYACTFFYLWKPDAIVNGMQMHLTLKTTQNAPKGALLDPYFHLLCFTALEEDLPYLRNRGYTIGTSLTPSHHPLKFSILWLHIKVCRLVVCACKVHDLYSIKWPHATTLIWHYLPQEILVILIILTFKLL